MDGARVHALALVMTRAWHPLPAVLEHHLARASAPRS